MVLGMRRTAWVGAASVALCAPLLVTTGGGAQATYEGPVGRLAFAMQVDDNVDVYTARSDGAALRQLTDEPGYDACPAYDPSGKRIAFCSDRSGSFEIWTMAADGSRQRQLTDLEGFSTFPDWSPSGNHVAFGGTHDPEGLPDIWRVRNNGTRARQLTFTPHLADEFPVWRPGHEQIAFVRFDVPDLGSQIWLMRGDGTRQRPLTFDDAQKDQLPDWSPDGERLAYVADGDVWVMGADGSNQRNVTSSAADELGAAWSPDGERIAFVRDPAGPARPIWTMRPDGSDQQRLLPGNDDLQFVPGWQPRPRTDDCTPRVRDLGTLPGGRNSEVLAMNGHGLVVGSARDASNKEHAVWWRRGRIHDFGVRADAWAADVNERRTVVGNFALDEGDPFSGHAFVWRRGNLDRLPGIGGRSEFVRRINERGLIVGAALDARDREHPIIWRNRQPRDLGIPDGYSGAAALGINDRGDIVGIAYNRFEALAWTWDLDGRSHALDRRGSFSQANVVDNSGRAAGLSDFGGNTGVYAALWPGQRRVDALGVFGDSDFSFALGTSGKSDFVGVADYYAGEGVGHVFLRRVTDYSVLRLANPGPLRTLMPLSGDPADYSNAHAALRSDPPLAAGSVTVGGESATGEGRIEHATLWTCAYQQAFVPDEELTTPPARAMPGAPLDVDRIAELSRSPLGG